MSGLPQLARLVAAMDEVLDRCEWSKTMTHESLLTYLIEESYELVDAVESGVTADVREELADVLLQVVFHSAISAREPAEGFGIEEVAESAADKMIRRHPHVFAGVDAPTVEDVLRVWSAAKAEEKAERASIMDGLPSALPALSLAAKTVGRIDRATLIDTHRTDSARDGTESAPTGHSHATLIDTHRTDSARDGTESAPTGHSHATLIDTHRTDSARDSSEPPLTECIGISIPDVPTPPDEEELGRLLLGIAAAAARAGLDPERALRRATAELQSSVRASEAARR